MMKHILAAALFTVFMSLTAGEAMAQRCDGSTPGGPCTTPLGPDRPGTCDAAIVGQCNLPDSVPRNCNNSQNMAVCALSNSQLGVCMVNGSATQCIDPVTQCRNVPNDQRKLCLLTDGDTGNCKDNKCCHQDETCDTVVGTCTSEDFYNVRTPDPDKGIISKIVNSVKGVLGTLSKTMFTRIVNNDSFRLVVSALITLYVAIYGVLFMFAMIQSTIHDFMIRMIKISVVAVLLSPTAWDFFNNTVVKFFNKGTDDIIAKVTSISVGLPMVANNGAFVVLDNAIAHAVSTKMAITLLSVATAGIYGPLIGLMLLLSLGSFFKAMMSAMWVYIMALVMRALLFGLAPIFLICILFQRTRHLFDGWLNQVVNACLQPILLFTFFGFFCQLILACIQQVLAMESCYTIWSEFIHGGPTIQYRWSPSVMGTSGMEPNTGGWGMEGPENAPNDTRISPLGIMLPLTLWLLADLAGRFNTVVLDIARDIAGATTSLSMGTESVKDWFSGGGSGGGGNPGGGGGGGNASSTVPRPQTGGGVTPPPAGGGGGSGGGNNNPPPPRPTSGPGSGAGTMPPLSRP